MANAKYIQSTSEYIGDVKPSFLKITSSLKQVAEIAEKLDSPKQTKSKSKEEINEKLFEVAEELKKIATKTHQLTAHINDLAQGNSNGASN